MRWRSDAVSKNASIFTSSMHGGGNSSKGDAITYVADEIRSNLAEIVTSGKENDLQYYSKLNFPLLFSKKLT